MKNIIKFHKKRGLHILKYCTSLFLILFIILGACTKLDDEEFNNIISARFKPTTEDVGALVGPAYVVWQALFEMSNDNNWRQGYRHLQEISSDILIIPKRPNGWDNNGMYRKLFQHQMDVYDVYGNGVWVNAYRGITTANRVIYQIEKGEIPVEASYQDSLIAELRVLRASYYYVLCDVFGNVPIITSYDLPVGFLPETRTRKQVYDTIVSEITSALPLLDERAGLVTYARFNKWAAYALLAKVYLNAEVYSGTAQWEKCIEACDAVINSGKYMLEANRKDVFKTENQNSKEIIFAIPYDELYAQAWGALMISLQPVSSATYNMQGTPWGGSCAVPQFIDTYDTTDIRLKDWIAGPQYSASGERLVGSMDLQGQPFSYKNEVPSVDSSTEMSGYREGKYEYKIGVMSFLSNDQPLLRYADVLLMKAEALLRTGNAGDAASLVTEIRERCFPDNPEKAAVTGADLQQGSSYQYGLKDYKHNKFTNEGGADIQFGRFLDELGWEFAQEGHRRQDMIRFGIFSRKSYLSHDATGESENYQLFPIPANEISKNSNLVQNQGY